MLLLVTTCICWSSPTPRTTSYLKLDPMGIKNTYLTQNNMWYPFFSIYETERTLLMFFTHNTFDTLSTSLDSNQNDTILDPHIACLTHVPNSTNKSKLVSVKVSNNSLAPIIWKYSLLSTNQTPNPRNCT
jgi:hypothetical protein